MHIFFQGDNSISWSIGIQRIHFKDNGPLNKIQPLVYIINYVFFDIGISILKRKCLCVYIWASQEWVHVLHSMPGSHTHLTIDVLLFDVTSLKYVIVKKTNKKKNKKKRLNEK